MEHSVIDLWMWKRSKLHLYLPIPKCNVQGGLKKLLLTFLDDAIDKNPFGHLEPVSQFKLCFGTSQMDFPLPPQMHESAAKQGYSDVYPILLCP